jgi:phosphoribosylanthranilate isomerase
MPSGPGVITLDAIKEIVKELPPVISSVLLTSSQNAEEIISQQRFTGTNTLQICDELDESEYIKLREVIPSVKLIQVIHVTGVDSIKEAVKKADMADGLLLDSGDPGLTIKILGGTGKTHNWDVSRQICEKINKPVFLAGGLNADNIIEAIEFVKPYGVDVCSGLRTGGRLDEIKVKEFMKKICQLNIK